MNAAACPLNSFCAEKEKKRKEKNNYTTEDTVLISIAVLMQRFLSFSAKKEVASGIL